MSTQRPSAFSETPEDLLARAAAWRVDEHAPVDNQLLVRDLGKALERERLDRATSSSLIRAINLDFGAIHRKYRRLRGTAAIALLAAGLAVFACSALVWHTRSLIARCCPPVATGIE